VKTNKDLMFALGIAAGTAVGFVLGSLVAFRVGENGVETVRRMIERALGREGGPNFEYLLQ
jgi:hypothetical protein